MVTVTMAARQLKHGTVVLFNIWLRRRTACFYHIILSQERRLLHADVPTPLCSPRSPAVAMFLPYLTTTTKANWLRTVCPWCSPTDTLSTVCITWDAFFAVCERLTNTTDNKNKPVYVESNVKIKMSMFSCCFLLFSKLQKLACFFPVGYQTFSYFNLSYAGTPATCSLSKLCQKFKLWMLTALFCSSIEIQTWF